MYINLNDFGNEIEQNKLTTDQAIEEQNIIYKKYRLREWPGRKGKRRF